MMVDFMYIWTQVNLLWEVLYIKVQNGKLKVIAYVSKRLPETARNYSIPELELCGLAINIA